MRTTRTARCRSLVPSLALALALAACGDDSTGPRPPEFDAVETAAVLEDALALAGARGDVFAGLDLAGEAIERYGGSAALLPGRSGDRALLPGFEDAGRLAASVQAPVFPSELLGKTLVYDLGTDRYVVDETATGAPANGVRFVLYAMNPITHRPAEPLVVIGRVDLTDESSAASTRIGIEVVDASGSTETTVVDYFIDASSTAAGGSQGLRLQADGYLSDGSLRLDFSLDQAVTFTEGSPTFDIAVSHVLSLPGQGVEIALEAEGAVEVEGGEPAGLSVEMAIEKGGAATVLDVAVRPNGTISGTFSHDGAAVILIRGNAEHPSFTRPDGGEPSQEELAALAYLYAGVGGVLEFAGGIFSPFGD